MFNNVLSKLDSSFPEATLDSSATLSVLEIPKLLQKVRSVFAKYHVSFCSGPFEYRQHTNDFGISLKKLLFLRSYSGSREEEAAEQQFGLKIQHFFSNMQALAIRFGFELQPTTDQYMPRDKLIRTGAGTITTFVPNDVISPAMDRANSLSFYQRSKPLALTDHTTFHDFSGPIPIPLSSEIAAFSSGVYLQFYIEGGNYYRLTNTEGKIKVVLGKETLYGALNQLRLMRSFKKMPEKMSGETLALIKSILLQNKNVLKETLCEMYAQGLLKPAPGREKGIVSDEEVSKLWEEYNPTTKTTLLQQAIDKRVFIYPYFSEKDLQDGLEIAAKYLAQLQCTKEIIAETFCVTPADLITPPQCDYHLDIFMRPGPKGSVFLQSFEHTTDLLQEIQKQQNELNLDISDRTMLQRYLETSIKLQKELGTIYLETKTLLEKAGITVLPTPGVFYDNSPKINSNSSSFTYINTSHVNFLNAISGWSEKANTYFYIASGASIKPHGRLAGILMESFKTFIQSYQPNTEVVFIGHSPDDFEDFAEAMRWGNFPGTRLGPHCLSFELETSSHKEP